MHPDNPPPIPPGQAIAVIPDRVELIRSRNPVSGVLVDGVGRVTVVLNGEGARATFAHPEALRCFALALLTAAEQLETAQVAASDEAAAELQDIVASYERANNG